MSEDATSIDAGSSVLLVDDERALTEVVATALSARGYRVSTATDGRSALAAVAAEPPDLVLLDLGLPDIDGLVVCRQLRTWFSNPVIILSADGDEHRKVEALDAGADDYVTKPFSTPELLARTRVAIRHRRRVAALVDESPIAIGDLVIDPSSRVVSVAGEPLALTRKEFGLLLLLARNLDRVLPYRTILEQVWPTDEIGRGSMNSLRVHVTNLRRKIGSGPDLPTIVTSAGVGYSMTAAGPATDVARG